jgi:Flp pilus assembly protein TadD
VNGTERSRAPVRAKIALAIADAITVVVASPAPKMRSLGRSSSSRRFAQANRAAPQFADPLKAWGDALAQRGQWAQARVKYDQALRIAPDWLQLRRARAGLSKNAAPPRETLNYWAFE